VLSMIGNADTATAPACAAVNGELFRRMVQNGESFWNAVYEPFMARDLTRENLRAIVREGLTQTRGGYKAVAALFNVPSDHRRLLSFLRKHDCHLPEHDLRSASAELDRSKARRAVEK
jgi:hypothetical protein